MSDGEFGGVQGDGAPIGALVEVNVVAAGAAAAALTGAQQAAGAGGGHPQRPSGPGAGGLPSQWQEAEAELGHMAVKLPDDAPLHRDSTSECPTDGAIRGNARTTERTRAR